MQVYLGAVAIVLAIPVLLWAIHGLGVADLRPGRLNRQVRSTLELGSDTSAVRQTALPSTSAPARVVEGLARGGRRIAPEKALGKLQRQRQLAGLSSSWSIDKLLALKLASAVIGVGLAVLVVVTNPSGTSLLFGALLAFLGFYAPDAWLSRKADARQTIIRRELADTIDQITICVEAGLGFDAAMARAGRTGRGPLAEELRRVLQDVQIGVPRPQALEQLLVRTDVPDLRHFVVALRQAERYGVPIANVLRVQAAELREKRKAHAEEESQKLPVKLLFPLILCVLPVLFIVLVGPAAIRIANSNIGG